VHRVHHHQDQNKSTHVRTYNHSQQVKIYEITNENSKQRNKINRPLYWWYGEI
jgi:hypothetical protein